ncbi:uncharacterized protein FOMMEDRAFT_160704 [Fomitiporia mediterranea MF3/22]|uniref:uncharacterized protein n=1 Tax=Fomitiporia mediterranea (strain MF3/22) TaxID=694068 RepID=UPI00044072D7|nr:uncharacterized protein FOMMEDRAFT_160704 [Fomitiporia mediterranea MF3/22]EJC99138.1 hypothetical protein FOMMEDRAFT_160704 [Fomitiporia mediterranea MF3/22]
MPNNVFNNSRMSSHSAAQATIDEHTLATMSMYDHSQGAIASPTPHTSPSPPTIPCLASPLMGPHCVRLLSQVLSMNHRNSGPPLTPLEPSPSTPSTSPSPFEPERPRDIPLQSSTATTQFTTPPFLRRSQSMQRARTDTALPAAQISSFNTADLNPGVPLFLATHRRVVLPTCLTSVISAICATSRRSPYAHAIQLAGPSDDPSVVTKTTSFGPRCIPPLCRECRLRKNEAVAVVIAKGNPVAQRQRQADLSKTISNQSRLLSVEECKYWDDLAKQWKKGTRRCGLEHK